MNSPLIEKLKQRRTQYALGRNVSLDKEALTSLIKEAIRHTPSPFNSQSSRAVILFGKQSEQFWELTKQELSKIVPPEAFANTVAKLDGFAAGIGTVLFYEDQSVVKGMQDQFALYADNFPIWSEQSSGMAQFAVWLALTEAGAGASLQHYNPVTDEAARKEWNVPASWKLRAQMPFGSNEGGFGEKAFMDDAQRFIIKS
ncbi:MULTISPECIES: nitroreductase family protein [Rhodanobacter]|uniref:nitroreductase family protein n=1 Tax=Rhodanobacter TaxID=75309 RepID=UPI0004295180|nr:MULTISPECIES: nitroreductase family protein [Rhodanobacter]TAN16657.1 MAG: nitroreductase family protein [Rhodanobacter sp.]UJJ55495.1 nitroreductase family protein [Rhodanobacter thiooxydans]